MIPNDHVHQKFKISYDGLNDDIEEEIYLDIACFFIGMDRNDVVHILNDCKFFPEIGIHVLVERSLVTVDERNRLRMHHFCEIWEEKSFVRNHQRIRRSVADCGLIRMCLMFCQNKQ